MFRKVLLRPFPYPAPGVPEEFLSAFNDKHGLVIDSVCLINLL